MMENSILMSPDMARAYAENRKWVTRSPITRLNGIGEITEFGHNDGVSHEWEFFDKQEIWHDLTTDELLERCPYGQAGESIRLLTTWAVSDRWDYLKPSELPHDANVWTYFRGKKKPIQFGRLRPGRFMPLFLRHWMPYPKIISIGAERVQDISEEDARAEGIFETPRDPGFESWSTYGMRDYYATPMRAFRALWDSIHGPGAWERNDWVWRIEIEKYSEVRDAD